MLWPEKIALEIAIDSNAGLNSCVFIILLSLSTYAVYVELPQSLGQFFVAIVVASAGSKSMVHPQ